MKSRDRDRCLTVSVCRSMLRIWQVSRTDCEAEEDGMRAICYQLLRNGAQGLDVLANTPVIVSTSREVFNHVLAGIRRNYNLTVCDRSAFARLNAQLRDGEARCTTAKVDDQQVELGIRDAHGVQIDTHNALWSHQHWDDLSLKQETTEVRVRFTIVGVTVYPEFRASQSTARSLSMCVAQAKAAESNGTLLRRFWVFVRIPELPHPDLGVVRSARIRYLARCRK